jgi:hypothetical protein
MAAHDALGPSLQAALFAAGELPPDVQVEQFTAQARAALAKPS